MAERDITSIVANHIAGAVARAVPQAVLAKARLHVLDSFAAMISGARLRPGRVGAAFAARLGGAPDASIAGVARLNSPVNAAFANAMAAHADETDDSHLDGRFHPGCAVIPTALATAEANGRGGLDFLKAVILGYDIGARATKALGMTSPRSWTHSTHCLGANFAAAAAAGALCDLTAEQAAHLLSYATQQASGLAYWQKDSEHIEKAFDFGGMGARNGVFGALFVAGGASGVADSLTGEHSYMAAFSQEARPEELAAELGERFEIMSASIKKWCVGSPIQAALDSLEWLMAEQGVTAAATARLTATLPDDRFVVVDNRDMPDICLQHLLAVMLLDGTLSFESAHDLARMRATDVLALRERIEARPNAELTQARPARQAIVEIETTDGRRLTRRTRAVRGTPDNPMTEAEVEAKARDLITPALGAAGAEALIEACRRLEHAPDMTAIATLLRK